MEKIKAKEESSVFEYLWNEFLFRKNFTFETQKPIDDCYKSLSRLQTMDEGFFSDVWSRQRITGAVLDHGKDNYVFSLEIQRRNKGIFFTTARASGTISHDQCGVSVIVGQAKLGTFYNIMVLVIIAVILFMMFGVIEGITSKNLFVGLFILVTLVIVWLQMLSDRDQLISQIRSAIL